ncbi:hypothetical protein J4475_01070 [Candidatus Woesearchaeota archaeon]|nr:hypothetical protein [Candidatus Woesearchaeota archaeon]
MDFESGKRQFLLKKDKSRKGSIDEPVKSLLDLLNSHKDYYTTSSCSGRILLLAPSKVKKDTAYALVSHGAVDFSSVKKALEESSETELWFRQEGFIVHTRCRTLEAAENLLMVGQSLGLKRSGIISTANTTVELVSTEHFDTIVKKAGKILCSDEFLMVLAEEANIRMAGNTNKLRKLESKIKNMI